MDRTAWTTAFIDELQRLRPHLAPTWGASKIALAIASQAYAGGPEVDPKEAARRYHASQVPPAPAKRK